MHVVIVAPSLKVENNVSGVSAVTNFIIAHNKECEYTHFLQGKSDGESGALKRIVRIWRNYRRWKGDVNDNVRSTLVASLAKNDNVNVNVNDNVRSTLVASLAKNDNEDEDENKNENSRELV